MLTKAGDDRLLAVLERIAAALERNAGVDPAVTLARMGGFERRGDEEVLEDIGEEIRERTR